MCKGSGDGVGRQERSCKVAVRGVRSRQVDESTDGRERNTAPLPCCVEVKLPSLPASPSLSPPPSVLLTPSWAGDGTQGMQGKHTAR